MEGWSSDPRQKFLGKEFRFLDRYELQAGLVETLKQAKNHRIRRKAAQCEGCHRDFRHWRCRNNHDWVEAENSCSLRVCPHCSHRRAKILGSRMDKFLLGREASSLRYCVLAERNSKDLGEGIASLWAAWNRLRRSVRWKRKVRGCIVALEVTFNKKNSTWHPHLNVLMEGDYFPFEELRQSWSEATLHKGRTSFIRAADVGTVQELIKYVTKIADLIGNVEALETLLLTTHKKRFVRTYGSFYGLSVEDESKPVQESCPDCESTEIVALGRVDRWAEQLEIDFKGVFRVRSPRPCGRVASDEADAVSFNGLFLRHKYAQRPGHERTPAWADRLAQRMREYAHAKHSSLRQPAA